MNIVQWFDTLVLKYSIRLVKSVHFSFFVIKLFEVWRNL
jgi:hypothetical protein